MIFKGQSYFYQSENSFSGFPHSRKKWNSRRGEGFGDRGQEGTLTNPQKEKKDIGMREK